MNSLKAGFGKSSVDMVYRIETDKFKICEGKEIRKRKWIFFQQSFVVHVKDDGHIEWKELK